MNRNPGPPSPPPQNFPPSSPSVSIEPQPIGERHASIPPRSADPIPPTCHVLPSVRTPRNHPIRRDPPRARRRCHHRQNPGERPAPARFRENQRRRLHEGSHRGDARKFDENLRPRPRAVSTLSQTPQGDVVAEVSLVQPFILGRT